jgi:hypothetical protein
VRDVIHSSLVSTMVSSSALVMTREGTLMPVPEMIALRVPIKSPDYADFGSTTSRPL